MSIYDPFEHMTNKEKKEILEKDYKNRTLEKTLRAMEEREYNHDYTPLKQTTIDKLDDVRYKLGEWCCGCGCLSLLMPPTGICSIIGALVGVICGIIVEFSELYENWSVAVAVILGLAYGCGWVGAIIDRIIHWVKYR